jgi:hypothetical protein
MKILKFKKNTLQFKATIVLTLVFGMSFAQSQTNNELLARKVFTNITNSVGNNFPSPPKLTIIDSEDKVAYISNGNVYLEKKALNLLCNISNKEDAIAYVLSHELAHHYLNHSWMKNIGFTFTSELKNQLNKDLKTANIRKTEETQADLFGGFFSQISGYNSLQIAEDVLKLLYKNYNLPEIIEGYPSLTDRENIVKNNLEELNKLSIIFKTGNLMAVTEEYSNAIKCYEHILSKNFTSREIYNNLGALYLLKAINFDDNLSKYSFPILFEGNSRASFKETTRGFDGLSETKRRDTINYYLNLADDNFKRSVHLDKNFKKAKINLLISEIIKIKVEKKSLNINFQKNIEDLKLNISDESDIKLICYYLGLINEIDEKDYLKKASMISAFNHNTFHDIITQKDIINTSIKNQYNKLINELEFNGLNKIDLSISSGDGIKIKINNTEKHTILEYNNSKYFVNVAKNNITDVDLLNLDLNKDFIINKYGTPSSTYIINNLLYLNYKNNKFVIVLFENQLSEIIYYN